MFECNIFQTIFNRFWLLNNNFAKCRNVDLMWFLEIFVNSCKYLSTDNFLFNQQNDLKMSYFEKCFKNQIFLFLKIVSWMSTIDTYIDHHSIDKIEFKPIDLSSKYRLYRQERYTRAGSLYNTEERGHEGFSGFACLKFEKKKKTGRIYFYNYCSISFYYIMYMFYVLLSAYLVMRIRWFFLSFSFSGHSRT